MANFSSTDPVVRLPGALLLCISSACAGSGNPSAAASSTPTTATQSSEPGCGYGTVSDMIAVSSPQPGDRIVSPLVVRGAARGPWFFEADFPVSLQDGQGVEIATGIAAAQGEWMTEAFVPFEAQLQFEPGTAGEGRLLLHKDNPSGQRERDATFCIPVRL